MGETPTTDSISIFDQVKRQQAFSLSIVDFKKGIDNYHIDINLSRQFCRELRNVVTHLLPQQTATKQKQWDNSKAFDRLKDYYTDLSTVLMHRIKTDLSPEQVCFLHMAVVKQILISSRGELDKEVSKTSTKLADLRQKSSSATLSADQQLFWLKKNYQSILYHINKQIFQALRRTEEKKLKIDRQQFMPDHWSQFSEIVFNPLLYTTDPSALSLLIHEYSMWNWSGNESGFINVNQDLEQLFQDKLPELPFGPLNKNDHAVVNAEIHDELGGIFSSQPFLGPAEDSKDSLQVHLDWMDIPSNMTLLFDLAAAQEKLEANAKELGFSGRRQRKNEITVLRKVLKSTTQIYSKRQLAQQLFATAATVKTLTPIIKERIDLKLLCQFFGGDLGITKLQDNLSPSQALTTEQIKQLNSTKDVVRAKVSSNDPDSLLEILTQYSRYRRDLKYHRFAHRAFNRLKLLTKEEDLLLSREANTLFSLPMTNEVETEQERVCHHAILKADVRGSTTVTDELENKGLNPASYFSQRFFDPINEILESYGANKVFIEGDAIILSFLEFDQSPQQWFAVSRACGLAKDMLRIVNANNRHSSQMGLPLLELGVGICYSNEAPRFLYDDGKPIMISSAIGLADRMSSCSWNLRQALPKSLFSIEVLKIADGDNSKGEKGQQYIRYNVNGILIDEASIGKIRKEIKLETVNLRLNGSDCRFLIGQYPDMNGKKKELIIRQSKVGIWRELQIEEDSESEEYFYEVVVNRKVTTLVLDTLGRRANTNASSTSSNSAAV